MEGQRKRENFDTRDPSWCQSYPGRYCREKLKYVVILSICLKVKYVKVKLFSCDYFVVADNILVSNGFHKIGNCFVYI